MESLARLVKRARGTMSREQVAQEVSEIIGREFHQQRLYRIENGSRPEFDEIEGFGATLGVDVTDLWAAYQREFGNEALRRAMEDAIARGDRDKALSFLDLLIAA